jgi:NAD-dependent DNA ligase
MKSLNDVKTKEEVQDWIVRISKLLPINTKLDFYCEYKFDGPKLNLTRFEDRSLTASSKRISETAHQLKYSEIKKR